MASSGPARVESSIVERILARAPAYWRYIQEKPSWILMFAFARTLTGRKMERWVHRARYRRPQPVVASLFPRLDLEAAVAGLVGDGVYVGINLSQDIVQEIRSFAQGRECYSRDRQDQGFLPADVATANASRDRDVIAAYYFEAVEECPAICRLKEDPALLSIATAYLGQSAIWIRTRLWWSFPAERVTDADLHAVAQDKFHFDMNGWRTVKFFFYLTPINERSGPHRCILGSHRHRPLMQQFTLTVGRPVEELEQIYGKERFLTITGDSGTGFAEDPFTFHTGSLCQDAPRLILEFEYGSTTSNPSYHYGRLG